MATIDESAKFRTVENENVKYRNVEYQNVKYRTVEDDSLKCRTVGDEGVKFRTVEDGSVKYSTDADESVKYGTVEDHLPELLLAGFKEQANPDDCPTARECGPAVFHGEGQMILWKECAAFYMKPGDKNWKTMPSTGEMVLRRDWEAYLTGGEIWMQDLEDGNDASGAGF